MQGVWLTYRIDSMIGRPQPDEADSYYFTYIQKVAGEDPLRTIENQLDQYSPWLRRISEEKSSSTDTLQISGVLNRC